MAAIRNGCLTDFGLGPLSSEGRPQSLCLEEECPLLPKFMLCCNSQQGIPILSNGPIFKEIRLKGTLLTHKWALHRPSILLRVLSTRELTHTDDKGKSKMVDVGSKQTTRRTAKAVGVIHVGPVVARLIQENNIKKGDVISVARLAGIMGAKRTSELIPLCHNIVLNQVQVEATLQDEDVIIEATVKCDGKTGVEMEALTAVATAALTVYDMCKAVTHDMCIREIKLTQKTGGSRGDFQR